MTAAEYRLALDAPPYGKRLPGAVYLIDPGEDTRIPSLLRITAPGGNIPLERTQASG